MFFTFFLILQLLLLGAELFIFHQRSQTSPRREKIAIEIVIFSEVRLELFYNEVDLSLSRLAEMRLVAELVSRSSHGMAEVVDDEDEPSVLRFRHDNAMVILEKPFLENEVSATRRHNPLVSIWLVHLPNLVSVHTRTVNNYFSLDREFFAFRVKLIHAHASHYLTTLVLNEAFEFDIVG